MSKLNRIKMTVAKLPLIKSYLKSDFHILRSIKRNYAFQNQCDDFIDRYMPDALKSNDRFKQYLDIRKTCDKYSFSINEYFSYKLYLYNEDGKNSFVSDAWKTEFFSLVFNSNETFYFLKDKYKTFLKFQRFFKRDCILLDQNTKYEEFASFTKKHSRYFIKPLKLNCGKGAAVCSGGGQELFEHLKNKYEEAIIEELIVQSEELAKFHPESVNTIRVSTVLIDGNVEIIQPFFRMGCGKSVVDNAGAGGVMGVIDIDSGVIFCAADETGRKFIFHPDTNEQILGFKVPYWTELLQIAKEAALQIPDNHYTSWDFALTDQGWVMVEANSNGSMFFQNATQEGYKAEAIEYLNRFSECSVGADTRSS